LEKPRKFSLFTQPRPEIQFAGLAIPMSRTQFGPDNAFGVSQFSNLANAELILQACPKESAFRRR